MKNATLKNVTITMEEDVARWIRVEAARRNTSVSKLVGEMVKEKMQHEDSYRQAMEDYQSRGAFIPPHETPLPKREELYDRQILR